MAKQINTRLMLKHDSLTNWNESSLVLKPGEVGVAYVDVATKDAKGNIVHVPTALLKVGENVENSTKTFKDLPFVSAVAADVYAWAKKEGIEVVDEGQGEVLSDVAWDAEKNALVLSRIDVVTPAELTSALGGYYTKTEVDNLLAGLSVGALEARVEAVETAVNTTLPGQIGAVDAKFADYTKTADLPTDLGDFTNDAGYAKTADVNATLANYSTTDQMNAAIDADVKVVNDALEVYKTANDTALAGVRATAESKQNALTEAQLAAANSGINIDKVADYDAVKQTVDNFFAEDAAVNDVVDTLKEITNYIATDKEGAADIASRLGAAEGEIDALQALPATAISSKDIVAWNGEVGAKALAQGVKDVVDVNKTTWDKAGTALQAADLADYAKSADITTEISNAIAGEVSRADGAYAPKEATATGIQEAKDAAAAAQAKADAALPTATAEADYLKKTDAASTYRAKDVAITSDDLSDEVFVFNCGTASTVI